ncbi:MAG TPA: DNA polymerase III subunit delta' [Candidatus Syntrophosphaera sp.]|nr:DNA polymerase III subunit delta' [Candidatus Syntrophosphaera sp.]
MFRKLKGQSGALQVLQTALEHDRIAQAYLFHGGDGVGKFTAALYFGMALNCLAKSEFRPCGVCNNCRRFSAFDHPDLIYLFPTPNWPFSADGEFKKEEDYAQYRAYIKNKIASPWQEFWFSASCEIRVDSVRQLIRRLELSAFEASYRICIIENADAMNTATANALLKTLEEPPPATVLILTTERLASLLPTIVSRCQPVYFQPVPPRIVEELLSAEFNATTEQARTASRIADGNVKRAIHLVQSESSGIRDRAYEILQQAALGHDWQFWQNLQSPQARPTAETTMELIKYLNLFVSDLNLVFNAPEQLVNIDKKDWLQEARDNLVRCDAAQLADRVWQYLLQTEDLARKVNGNVNLQLVHINLYFALCKVFRG